MLASLEIDTTLNEEERTLPLEGFVAPGDIFGGFVDATMDCVKCLKEGLVIYIFYYDGKDST